ncbi:hypothetical protein FsymDg_4338 [Candidatus Protofrankia datiscae]|uniref:Uncharacterized protein n=1 Tax=Candidatus Protofrankia datiscae TaxID=2716812 RepID=F8AX27_9ACTN|nr:hypothetical protein FsymDg_4338 [Candidatus Protofrankia datiscae]
MLGVLVHLDGRLSAHSVRVVLPGLAYRCRHIGVDAAADVFGTDASAATCRLRWPACGRRRGDRDGIGASVLSREP